MQAERIYSYGLCECGCGAKAPVATRNSTFHGYVKGRPKRFIHGHHSKGKSKRPEFDVRTCEFCLRELTRPLGYTVAQWQRRRFCPTECAGRAEQRAWVSPDGPPWVVGRDGCWLWSGLIYPRTGYGQIRVAGRNMGAHLWVYGLAVGPVPDGLELDHVCHTRDSSCAGSGTCLHRRCVNPDHLEPVTPTENIRRARSTRLTSDVVREIRRRYAEAPTAPNGRKPGFVAAITEEFNVSSSHIYNIVTGVRWKE